MKYYSGHLSAVRKWRARLQIMLKVGCKDQKFMASISDFGQNSSKVGGSWINALNLYIPYLKAPAVDLWMTKVESLWKTLKDRNCLRIRAIYSEKKTFSWKVLNVFRDNFVYIILTIPNCSMSKQVLRNGYGQKMKGTIDHRKRVGLLLSIRDVRVVPQPRISLDL